MEIILVEQRKKQGPNVIWRQMYFEKMSYPAKVRTGHVMMQILYYDVWVEGSNIRSWPRPHQNSISRKVSIFLQHLYIYNNQPLRDSKYTTKRCLNLDASSKISFSLTAMPIPSFIKSRQPDLQLKITTQDKNKFPRKLLLVKIKVHEKPMPGTLHPPFPSASSLPAWSQPSTSQGFAPSASVASGNSNLVTQECFDLPIQSHYSAGQIHWPRALHNTLL